MHARHDAARRRPDGTACNLQVMTSIPDQMLPLTVRHAPYPAIDPGGALNGTAAGKVVCGTAASQGIGQATCVAFARAGAAVVYLAARSERGLEETARDVLA